MLLDDEDGWGCEPLVTVQAAQPAVRIAEPTDPCEGVVGMLGCPLPGEASRPCLTCPALPWPRAVAPPWARCRLPAPTVLPRRCPGLPFDVERLPPRPA